MSQLKKVPLTLFTFKVERRFCASMYSTCNVVDGQFMIPTVEVGQRVETHF